MHKLPEFKINTCDENNHTKILEERLMEERVYFYIVWPNCLKYYL